MTKRILVAAALAMGLAVPAQADPTIGFGFSLTFGGATPDVGVGVRVFSDNEEDKAALSLGLDYMFGSNTVRPTVGLGYMGDGGFIGFDLGFGMDGGGVDFGVSVGGANTEAAPVTVPVVVVSPPIGQCEGGPCPE